MRIFQAICCLLFLAGCQKVELEIAFGDVSINVPDPVDVAQSFDAIVHVADNGQEPTLEWWWSINGTPIHQGSVSSRSEVEDSGGVSAEAWTWEIEPPEEEGLGDLQEEADLRGTLVVRFTQGSGQEQIYSRFYSEETTVNNDGGGSTGGGSTGGGSTGGGSTGGGSTDGGSTDEYASCTFLNTGSGNWMCLDSLEVSAVVDWCEGSDIVEVEGEEVSGARVYADGACDTTCFTRKCVFTGPPVSGVGDGDTEFALPNIESDLRVYGVEEDWYGPEGDEEWPSEEYENACLEFGGEELRELDEPDPEECDDSGGEESGGEESGGGESGGEESGGGESGGEESVARCEFTSIDGSASLCIESSEVMPAEMRDICPDSGDVAAEACDVNKYESVCDFAEGLSMDLGSFDASFAGMDALEEFRLFSDSPEIPAKDFCEADGVGGTYTHYACLEEVDGSDLWFPRGNESCPANTCADIRSAYDMLDMDRSAGATYHFRLSESENYETNCLFDGEGSWMKVVDVNSAPNMAHDKLIYELQEGDCSPLEATRVRSVPLSDDTFSPGFCVVPAQQFRVCLEVESDHECVESAIFDPSSEDLPFESLAFLIRTSAFTDADHPFVAECETETFDCGGCGEMSDPYTGDGYVRASSTGQVLLGFSPLGGECGTDPHDYDFGIGFLETRAEIDPDDWTPSDLCHAGIWDVDENEAICLPMHVWVR